MNTADDEELVAMSAIWSALKALPDEESKLRCINWALSRLGLSPPVGVAQKSSAGPTLEPSHVGPAPGGTTQDPLEDIVERGENGELRVIARDLKARSRNDAAIRLVYLVLFANEVLNRQQKTSSKKLVLPVLSAWRAYDGNTRGAIANDQGIKRDGDLLSLDVHSRREAQNFIAQIRDASTKGAWSPLASKPRKSGSKTKENE